MRLALAVVIVVVYGAGWVAPMWWLRKDPELVLIMTFLGGLLFVCVGVLAGGVAGYLD